MSRSPSDGYNSLVEAIPALASLNQTFSNLSPYLGGRNFTRGCLLAVSQSLQIIDGQIAFKQPSYFNKSYTIADIEDAGTYGSLCTTNGTAPRVLVPYRWCAEHCSGWELSHYNSLQQWIGPLVQFILPCLAFCLSIPRGWKISLPRWIFESDEDNIVAFFAYPAKFIIAFILVFFDTIIWLSICFAFAGPMFMSAVYEYMLDGMILDFLVPRKTPQPSIPAVTRARLLLAAVVGNIKLEPKRANRAATLPGMRTNSPTDEIWAHIMRIAEELLPRPLSSGRSPPVQSENPPLHSRSLSMPANIIEARSSISPSSVSDTHRTSLRQLNSGPALKLKALLNAQSSFGTAVGAPVVFFIGSFVYNIVEAETRLGDGDTAHALAFGMWWMTISHVAVIASAMLASNNPSALQGLIGKARIGRRGSSTSSAVVPKSLWGRLARWMKEIDILERAYDATYEPMSLWKRGPNKRLWIDKTIEAFEDERDSTKHIPVNEFRNAFEVGLVTRVGIWVNILIILLGAPCALAFATSYTTPVAGLGCRSLTHVIYYSTQVIQMMLWTWNIDVTRKNPKSRELRVCRGLQGVFGVVAVFAAIGGTIMQILGVYRNCISWSWTNKDHPDSTVGMSYITPDSVPMAGVWKITGALAAGILGLVSALAWWHQRRLRKKFIFEAESLERLGPM
ncbi:hypothetical protein PFICI_04117 [Pestalotiopsis fici W106-1]|uniref:Uncharacterized protein n=1 Tax=Pestalotiopsis fici (strain W106-1 / CGMCC3.15140) TaxID=1229662 RepID=W3XKU7_PESFW|nr:uncharacterized protein PFICI_04117 [Pestalotiopsis fici W106-1]ETS86092.1 hypothetical protein PFICI_04117 [Pestalotiopsis fici W106-1]